MSNATTRKKKARIKKVARTVVDQLMKITVFKSDKDNIIFQMVAKQQVAQDLESFNNACIIISADGKPMSHTIKNIVSRVGDTTFSSSMLINADQATAQMLTGTLKMSSIYPNNQLPSK